MVVSATGEEKELGEDDVTIRDDRKGKRRWMEKKAAPATLGVFAFFLGLMYNDTTTTATTTACRAEQVFN